MLHARARVGLFVLFVGCVVMIPLQSVASARLMDGLGGPAGYGSHRLPNVDDASSCTSAADGGMPGPIDISTPFPSGINFYGSTYRSLCLNNAGNVTFDHSITYFPSPLDGVGTRMIAPWWGDVETLAGSPADPDHDVVYWDVRPGQFTATWHNVGYYLMHDDQQNDFQLILRSVTGCGVGAFDVEFRYHQCLWVAGDSRGGSHGGIAAQAGFVLGDGAHFYALPGSFTDQVMDLCETSNVGEPGVWRFKIRDGEPPCPAIGMPCDTGAVGVCSVGTTICRLGADTCVMNLGSSPERCDGVDNDCNGSIDEGTPLCPAGMSCVQGSCVSACAVTGCPRGQACSQSGACVETGCLNVQCASGQRCQTGACVDACTGVVCPQPYSCVAGSCAAPCDGFTCPDGLVCENERCVSSCTCRSCPDNEACSPDGTCQPRDCVGMNCAPPQVCRSGLSGGDGGVPAACVDPCEGAVCPHGQHCESGACTENQFVPPDAGADVTVLDATTDAPVIDVVDVSETAVRDSGFDVGVGSDGGFSERSGSCNCDIPARSKRNGCWGVVLLGLVVLAARSKKSRSKTWAK